MIIHLSILAVILAVGIVYEHSIRVNKVSAATEKSGSYNYKSVLTPWLLVFGYIAFLSAMRTKMNDTSVYVHSFEVAGVGWQAFFDQVANAGKVKDWAFGALCVLFKTIVSDDYHMWFAFFAIIESLIFIYVLRRWSISFLDACFFFFCSTLYYNYFTMMRQWFAVSIVFLGIKFIEKDKFLPYLALCVFAAQFHNSAYIMVVLYFLVRGQAWGKRQITITVIFAIAMIFLQPLLNSLESVTSGTTYDYVTATMNTNSGSSVVRPIIACVPVVIAYIYRKNINDNMMNICVNMSLINLFLNVLATFTSGLYVIRLSIYTNIFNTILYPYILNIAIKEKDRRILKPLFYLIYLAFYFYQMQHQGAFGYSSDILGTFR